jgi:hypothetical protein
MPSSTWRGGAGDVPAAGVPGRRPGFRKTANYAEFDDKWKLLRILCYPYSN